MTRFGVMKHLRLLEEAGLVVTKRRGRLKLHFLNPVPIRLIHDRWVSKYTEPWAAAIGDPEIRSKYNFGAGVESDWKVGSPVMMGSRRPAGCSARARSSRSTPHV